MSSKEFGNQLCFTADLKIACMTFRRKDALKHRVSAFPLVRQFLVFPSNSDRPIESEMVIDPSIVQIVVKKHPLVIYIKIHS